jgi:hypothetical protein
MDPIVAAGDPGGTIENIKIRRAREFFPGPFLRPYGPGHAARIQAGN